MATAPATIVVDLAFGDCGKGTVVDHLVRRDGAATVVRFNGGPQAAHTVVTPDGRAHTFSQFGSGSFVPGASTVLSRFVLVEPYALSNEAAALTAAGAGDAVGRLTVDPRCAVITPANRAANRLRERARGTRAHGTCGIGFGSTVNDTIYRPDLVITAAELADRDAVARKLLASVRHKASRLGAVLASADGLDAEALRRPDWIPHAVDTYAALAWRVRIENATDVLRRAAGPVVFEGAQGVLLDETFGFHPHTTWSTTTFANADRVLDEAGWAGPRRRVGVVRSYFTRHGAGPFVTEDATLKPMLPEHHNGDGGPQGSFRVGPFDAVAARYAVRVAGPVDALAVTHLDRLVPRVCTGYVTDAGDRIADLPAGRPADLTPLLATCRPVHDPVPTDDPVAYADRIGSLLGVPVGLLSFGPTADDKLRRAGTPQGVCEVVAGPILFGTGLAPRPLM